MAKNPRVVWASDPPHLKALFSVLGVSEAGNNPTVLAMYAACGHPEVKSTRVPWCAAGMGWALVQANLPTSRPIKDNLLASSYLSYPGHRFTKHDTIPRGAICVWPRSSGSGHVNTALADLGDKLLCIGCNQDNDEGGGVTIVEYSKSSLRSAVLPIYPAEVVPLPRPRPPVDDEQEEPAPPPAPEPAQPALPWWHPKRIWLWITGGSGVGFLAAITDPWAWAKFFALTAGTLAALALLALAVALPLYGRRRVKDYLRQWLPRKEKP